MATFTMLMKKLLLTIMTFVYLAVASGASVNLHYCMDKLVSMDIMGRNDHNCPVCKTQKENSAKTEFSCKGCCKDELKQVKLENDHKAQQSFFSEISFESTEGTLHSNEYTLFIPVKLIGSYNINGPPTKHKVPTFLFNCVFRI